MQKMKSQGFTLVELIIIIVILGVLSIVALPKFLDLSSDARSASMAALSVALSEGARLVYVQAVLNDVQEESSATVTINGTEVGIVYGYPQSSILNSSGFSGEFDAWLGISANRYSDSDGTTDWLLTDDITTSGISLGVNNGGSAIGFVLDSYQNETGSTDNLSNCGVSYLQPSSAGETPEIEVFDSEC